MIHYLKFLTSIFFVISIFSIFVNCSGTPDLIVVEQQNKSLLQRYFEESNKGNDSFLEEYFHPDMIYHGPMGDWSKAQFIQSHNAILTAFPDLQLTVEDQIAEGDKVVTRWSAHGTHKGEFQGIAPTGKVVTITGIVISRYVNNMEIEAWEEFNMVGLLQQLDALP